jgi:uncharacterized protein
MTAVHANPDTETPRTGVYLFLVIGVISISFAAIFIRYAQAAGMPSILIAGAGNGLVALGREMAYRQPRLFRILRRYRPDVVTAMSGAFVAPPARLLGIPCVAWTDTEHASLQNRIGFPASAAVVTPACYHGPVPANKHLTYRGYHELAYLHPDRFTPDPEAIRDFGLIAGEPFSVVRLVSWKAHHDVGESGLSDLARVVEKLREHGRVVISSERPLDEKLDALVVQSGFAKIHHLLAAARLLVAESATMVSEAAVMGTPAIFANTIRLGYLTEQEERYGLVRCFHEPSSMLDDTLTAIDRWLSDPDLDDRCEAARQRLLDETQDVTLVVTDTVETYGRGESMPPGPISRRT